MQILNVLKVFKIVNNGSLIYKLMSENVQYVVIALLITFQLEIINTGMLCCCYDIVCLKYVCEKVIYFLKFKIHNNILLKITVKYVCEICIK